MENLVDFAKSGGLVPAIAQDAATGEILMLAYMNQESFDETMRTRQGMLLQPLPEQALEKG